MTPLSVIIVGAPRSGTYWAVDLLQSRFQIRCPSETHFIPLFAKYLWLWGDLSMAPNRRRLLINIYEFLQIWTARSSSSEEYLAQIRRLSLLVTLDEGRASNIIDDSKDYPSLVEAMFCHFAEIHGAKTSGDKSAHYQAIDPELTFRHFPNALMLHVIRDGRDVALSWMRQWFGPPTLTDAACKWREHVEINRNWGHQNAQRYLEIRYEDLAGNKEAEIRKLEVFLNRTASPEKLEQTGSALAEALSKTSSHSGMLDIVAAENVAKWKAEMAARDIAEFDALAAATLAESGYETLASHKSSPRRNFPTLSTHALRVAAKTILPLALGLCTRFRIPALALINRRYGLSWREVKVKKRATTKS